MSETNHKTKIFLSYHKPSVLLSDDVFCPIHVGRAMHEITPDSWLSQNLIGDDTGDNISVKNANYCELTAQYWAWKNEADADYIGFMHYRRHLNFNLHKHYRANRWGVISHPCIDSEYISRFGLTAENINNVIDGYDLVTVNRWDVTNAGSKSNYDHYAHSDPKLHIADYDRALRILHEKYPEFDRAVAEYNADTLGYFTNIFIMRRELFDAYCTWLFDILFQVERESDISDYDFQEARIYGYISEWLFGIYVTYLKQQKQTKILELQRTFVEDTDIPSPMHIVLASDQNYAKYVGVTIASILRKRKPSDILNFYVLDGGISDEIKRKIASLKKLGDFDIRYIKMDNSVFEKYPIPSEFHFTPATYFRLELPDLLPDVERVLYLDCDIIVRSSLSGLYKMDLTDAYCLGIRDVLVNQNTSRLGLERYINAGIMLVNLSAWRDIDTKTKFRNFIGENYDKIKWCDQDVINCVLQDGIKYIDANWNCQINEGDGGYSEQFRRAVRHAKIIHYISSQKPWQGRGGKYDRYYYSVLLHTPWRSDAYKYITGRIGRWVKTGVKRLFALTNTRWHAYKELTILGLRFFPRKEPQAPSLTSFRIRHFLLDIMPIKSLRKKMKQSIANQVLFTACKLRDSAQTAKIISDYCLRTATPELTAYLPDEFWDIYTSAVSSMGDSEFVEIIMNKRELNAK